MPGEVRAVVDTNVLVSGLINQAGFPGQILTAFRAGRFELITSIEINEEVLEVLNQPRIREKYHIGDRIFDIGAILYTQATLVEPKQRVKVSRDPKDNKFLEAALQGKVTYLVTGDKRDLLVLQEYKGIRIVTPAQFIQVIT
ncbi:MAG: putative toxin-antitoxin system toxin component, PIN family [Nitrospira sp.]|nr:putative toxin-antitoxin system toxin component, PIN family [Nitrospira sp.]